MTDKGPGSQIFVSYSRLDTEIAKFVVDTMATVAPGMKVFFDQSDLSVGGAWLTQLAAALDASRRVIALYSPNYWHSPTCQLEFTAALARQLDTGEPILWPILLQDVAIPSLFRAIQYSDCRDNDKSKIESSCQKLARSIDG
jgi:hypothetical protein